MLVTDLDVTNMQKILPTYFCHRRLKMATIIESPTSLSPIRTDHVQFVHYSDVGDFHQHHLPYEYGTKLYHMRKSYATYHWPHIICHISYAAFHMPHIICSISYAAYHMPHFKCRISYAAFHMGISYAS